MYDFRETESKKLKEWKSLEMFLLFILPIFVCAILLFLFLLFSFASFEINFTFWMQNKHTEREKNAHCAQLNRALLVNWLQI